MNFIRKHRKSINDPLNAHDHVPLSILTVADGRVEILSMMVTYGTDSGPLATGAVLQGECL